MVARGFTTSLWLDGTAEEAAEFYVSVFPDGKIERVVRYGEAGPGPAGSVVTVEFTINGQRFVGLNGGPQFTIDEAVSFEIHCEDQAEVDHYWAVLGEGGRAAECGWIADRFGVWWQVIPDGLIELITDPDPEKAARATRAMFGMSKLDIAALRRAHAGE
ncbi:VOC family protein [Actinomadura atramentaria]|uniref:VOC family protein n=1 Tax=Actinomadura atramentaria TaxID=1990 RepID=UPI00036A0362|nr:VOC family protein [Actinomadura atramentaria]